MAAQEPLEPKELPEEKEPITPGKISAGLGFGAAVIGAGAFAAGAIGSTPAAIVGGAIASVLGVGAAWLGFSDGGSPRPELPEGGILDAGGLGDAGGGIDAGAGSDGNVVDIGDIDGDVITIPEVVISDAPSVGDAGGGCFVADTLVALTESTSKPIQMIQIGDFILSRNEVTRELAEQKVLHIWTHNVKEILILKLSNGEKIETTKEHRFSIEDKGFVSAGSLKVGSKLDSYKEEDIRVVDIISKLQETTVYNIEVDIFHTYFISNTSVWVHNVKIVEEVLEIELPPQ
jgi:Pretoxin HINT domain